MHKINTILVFILLFISSSCYPDIKSCLQANSQIAPDAIKICKQALLTPGISEDDKSKIYVTHAAYLIAINQFNDADILLDTAFNTNPKMLENGTFRFNWLRIKGTLFFTKGDFVKSLPFFIGAKEVAEIMNTNKNKAISYNDLGATYIELHDNTNALIWLNKSLEIYKLENDSSYIANAFANIAEVYLSTAQYKKALEYFLNAVDILKKGILENNKKGGTFERPLAKIYLSIAHLHILQNQYLEANNNLLNALTLYQKYNLKNEEVKVLSTLGKLSLQQSQQDKARQLLQQAQTLEDTLENGNNLELKQNLTDLYLQSTEWGKAEEIALKGIEIAKEKQNLSAEVGFLNSLAFLYEKTNQFEKAISHYKLIETKKEQIYRNQYDKSQSQLLNDVEITNEQRQILKLKQEQSKRRLKEIKLQYIYLIIAVVLVSVVGYLLFLLNRKEKIRKAALADKEKHSNQLEKVIVNLENLTSDKKSHAQVSQLAKNKDLKPLLVDLMISCIDVWQNSTGKSPIDLAEDSGIWLVSIEEGQLRTRTMDKYMDIKKIPKNPRWRQVVKTAHYVLSKDNLNKTDKEKLDTKLNAVKEFIRNRAISH